MYIIDDNGIVKNKRTPYGSIFFYRYRLALHGILKKLIKKIV